MFFLFFQDVYDKLDYLSSLGKTQTAAVQRDADIGVAEAERDAGIRVWRLKTSAISNVSETQPLQYPQSSTRKQNVGRRWWTSSSWLIPGWPIPNESWSCTRLHLIRRLTPRLVLSDSNLHSEVFKLKLFDHLGFNVLRKLKLSWHMSCRQRKSNKRSAWRRLKSKLCRGRNKSLLRRRKSLELTRSSLLLWRDQQKLRLTRWCSWLKDTSKREKNFC